MAIELIVDTPVLKGEKGDKGDTGSFDYTHLEEVVDEHLDNRFSDVNASLDLKVDKEEGKSLVDDEYIEKLNNLETLDKTVVEKFNDKVDQSDLEENVIQMKSELQNYINENLEISKSGDMQRFVYDNDFDGIVERADRADNADNADKVNNLTVETAVPPNAFDLVTVEKDGIMSAADKVKLNGIQSGANYIEVVDNLESDFINKALSSSQGKVLNENITNLDNKFTDYINQDAVILFEGAAQPNENAIITLSESMKSYKILVFLIHQSSTGIPFGYGFYPIVDQTQVPGFAGQSVLCVDGVPYETNNVNTISLYSGRFENISNTQIKTIVPIHNILLRQGQPIGGASEYYIRQIWGIR